MKYHKKVIQALMLFSLVGIFLLSSCTDDDDNKKASPKVTSVTPSDNATNIGSNNPITITFNQAMDPATINSNTIVVRAAGTIVPGTVAYSSNMATFTPTDPLLASTEYTVMVSTEVKTSGGTALDAASITSFMTSALEAIELGTASNFVILAKTAITAVNDTTTSITGDIGLSPGGASNITGFVLTDSAGYSTASQVNGKIYTSDMADPTPANLTMAIDTMLAAYTSAIGRTNPGFTELGTGDLGGKTLTPGLYNWAGNVTIPSSIEISGGANDVWIFQIGGNLNVGGELNLDSAVNVNLTGGAQAKNVFWQVGGEVMLGSDSHFEGVILSMTSITLQPGASLTGQALAQTAVVLNGNNIVKK